MIDFRSDFVVELQESEAVINSLDMPQENLGEPSVFQSFSQETWGAVSFPSVVVVLFPLESHRRHGTSLAFFALV